MGKKKGTPRSVTFQFRVTAEEYSLILEVAAAAGQSASEWIRDLNTTGRLMITRMGKSGND
jgi:hypothetical protein